ncbi:MAG: DUF1640 domain-containing protein [Planctomycetes bacterium]|nr:DUF1640 domain-containing protein [Planctomycetota bacterium]
MSTITKLYPLLKDIGLDDKKSQEFIEIIEDSHHLKIEKEIKGLVTNETFITEISKLREEMSNMKVELIKWNVGTIIAVSGVVAAIVKLIG